MKVKLVKTELLNLTTRELMSLALTLNSNSRPAVEKSKSPRIQFKNQDQAFQMAKGYFSEFLNKDITSFAFSTVGYKNSQQKAMLAVACYFSQIQGMKTSLITDNLDGIFKTLTNNSLEVEIIAKNGTVISGYQFDGIYIFDMEHILDLCRDEKTSLDLVLETIREYSDVSFFDLPELEVIKEYLCIYRPLISSIQSLSVIYFEDNHNKIVEEVYEHFDKNGINLRGSLIQAP